MKASPFQNIIKLEKGFVKVKKIPQALLLFSGTY